VTFLAELDDARPEVRKDVAGTIAFYPKLDASGNVLASATSGHVHRTVYDNAGNVHAAQANVTPTTIVDADGNYSRIDLAIPAFDLLREDCYAVLVWRESGGSADRVETIYFDVVLQPWGRSTISLNDLQTHVSDIGDRITRQAARLSITKFELASLYGARAHNELYHRLRAQVSEDAGAALGDSDRITRPRLILDKRALHRVEGLIATSMVFESDMTSADPSLSDAAALYQHWAQRAHDAFRGLGPLRYDSSEDRAADITKPSFGRVVRLTRAQG